MIQRKLVLSPF